MSIKRLAGRQRCGMAISNASDDGLFAASFSSTFTTKQVLDVGKLVDVVLICLDYNVGFLGPMAFGGYF